MSMNTLFKKFVEAWNKGEFDSLTETSCDIIIECFKKCWSWINNTTLKSLKTIKRFFYVESVHINEKSCMRQGKFIVARIEEDLVYMALIFQYRGKKYRVLEPTHQMFLPIAKTALLHEADIIEKHFKDRAHNALGICILDNKNHPSVLLIEKSKLSWWRVCYIIIIFIATLFVKFF